VFEGPTGATRFGRRVPGDAQVKDPNGIGPCEEGEIRSTAFGAGMWGGKLPNTWEVIDAEPLRRASIDTSHDPTHGLVRASPGGEIARGGASLL